MHIGKFQVCMLLKLELTGMLKHLIIRLIYIWPSLPFNSSDAQSHLIILNLLQQKVLYFVAIEDYYKKHDMLKHVMKIYHVVK